jgi:tetratricopeptide (TPR) repeat protein
MPRLDASPSLKAVVKKRFSAQCAACHNGNALCIDVAHLFEDAAIRRASEERLILMCPNCNQGQDRTKHPTSKTYVHRLQPLEVFALASRRYRLGDYRGAYQSFRLTAYLYEQCARYSKAAESLLEAISALRPLRWGDLLKATVLQFERLCVTHSVGIVQRWLFLDRFALVLYDFRRWDWSARVHHASAQLRACISQDHRDPEQFAFDSMSSFRRESMLLCTTTNLSRSSIVDTTEELKRDAMEFLTLGRVDAYATNLDVAAKLQAEVLDNYDSAIELSETVLERKTQITHWWVLQEHHWRLARLYAQKGDRKREVDNTLSALRVFRDVPVVLEPTRGSMKHVCQHPVDELTMHEIPSSLLRENEVAPSGLGPREIPLKIQDRTIARIVNAVMKGG